ncbi:MAG: phosphoenolpyruvate--protein phosphotransferase, partial [Lentisphaeraceae bacterium]|nr:phosphoenolpyruvate--protein phosphotransferase [Lentisphaeraceae bacterium]
LIISLSVSLSLAIIAIHRVMGTLARVQESLTSTEPEVIDEKDELRLINESLDHFSEYFEKVQMSECEITQGIGAEIKKVEKSYRGRLVTGDPVCGEMYVLPSRTSAELVTSARLVGDLAEEVFFKAVEKVIEDLEEMSSLEGLSDDDKGIIEFQIIILNDPALLQEMKNSLAGGENLLGTLSRTFEVFENKLKNSDNAYMKERVNDFTDLKQRLFDAIHECYSQEGVNRFDKCKGKIVVCNHVLPSEVINLHKNGAVGIISKENTPSSHAQILLSSLNISSISNIDGLPVGILGGHKAVIDVINGKLITDPTDEEVKVIEDDYKNRSAEIVCEEVSLKSGEKIKVGVTVNNPGIESAHALEVCPDFVGLFRTEMHFIGQDKLPSEDELTSVYQSLISSFSDKLVVVRMLDLGADKIGGFQKVGPLEENPCMGRRSMRLLLDKPELFRLQLRAILKASGDNVCLLYPMISGWSELEKIEDFVKQTVKELTDEGHNVKTPKKGIMVEVPSVVTRFEDYVDHFEVFNIGTNDLTQYALAADRNNEYVSKYYKSSHPSILSMISKVAGLCKAKGKKAVICGQMGSDLQMLPLLIGLGIENISVNWAFVTQLKKEIQKLDYSECLKLAESALACKSVEEVERELGI